MARIFKDWLDAYTEYASYSEAPRRMHFWTGVWTLAGALRRHVWIDQEFFRWHVNNYIVLVAPPGIVSKSTTASIGQNLLKKIEGINFGPDSVTWPALVSSFAASTEQFQIGEEWHTQSAMSLFSSEFGLLLNPQDEGMANILIDLWDSKTGSFDKHTKANGKDKIENPWINILACTTPSWIAGSFPEHMIGGGFTSRCLFVYAEKKDKLVAFPSRAVPSNIKDVKAALISDLEHISKTLFGQYEYTPEAIAWGEKWYRIHNESPSSKLKNDERFGGYLARKWTHINKLAMVLAASVRDELIITLPDFELAEVMISDLEYDMQMVFSKIGRSEEAIQADRFIQFIKQQPREISFEEAYHYVHMHFPNMKDFEGIFSGAIQSGQIKIRKDANNKVWVFGPSNDGITGTNNLSDTNRSRGPDPAPTSSSQQLLDSTHPLPSDSVAPSPATPPPESSSESPSPQHRPA